MHSNGKGISASALPFRRTQPSWSKATPEDVSDQIFKFAKRGLSPSQIGVILRDSHGIPQVKFVTGNKILRILKTNGGFLFSEGVWGKGASISREQNLGARAGWNHGLFSRDTALGWCGCSGRDARQGNEGKGWRKFVLEPN